MSIREANERANPPTPRSRGIEPNTSPDGKWKTFPRVPNLLLYLPSGRFYGRVKVGGKIVRQSLGTDAFTTARLRLGDFWKDQRNCIKALLRTWPDLNASPPEKVTEPDCREWASRFAAEYDEQFFNNTFGTLRRILELAGSVGMTIPLSKSNGSA